ncbi:MAG: hypothetical protein B7Z05_04730 [Thiotrichales bacterium 32-46-8]|nr:MAG: hypothetical protein B7Z05_04730 [Thiotrichales bacterium 32-46-8]
MKVKAGQQLMSMLAGLRRLLVITLILVVPWQATWANLTKIDGHLLVDESRLHVIHSHDTIHHALYNGVFSYHHHEHDDGSSEHHDHAHPVFLSLISAEVVGMVAVCPILPHASLSLSFLDPQLDRLNRPPLIAS